MPVIPSEPIKPTSTCLSFARVATTDANPVSGKYTASMRRFGFSKYFRTGRLTDFRCGSNRARSSDERDASILLSVVLLLVLLLAMALPLLLQAGARSPLSGTESCRQSLGRR